jgi:hypothetical protein
VDAALAEMAVEIAGVAELIEEPSQLAQLLAEPCGWDGRILPSGPGRMGL